MTFSPPTQPSTKYASIIIGAFFCLLASACKEKPSTPDWTNEPTPTHPSTKHHPTVQSTSSVDVKETNTDTADKQTAPGQDVRFLAYNLQNYLTMRRYFNGAMNDVSKPEESITQLIKIIQNARPDILGVCEIGTPSDLKNLQARLKKAGIDLPHTHQTSGSDKVRTLALLSRFPIVSTAQPQVTSYQLKGRPFQISRGILDATIQLPTKQIRFLGVHFKSKRPIEEADQELMRRNESILLRQHIDNILTSDPKTLLMTYGDFNDSKRSKALYTVKGRNHSKKRLETLELSDSRDETWTHHWKREGVYSRFDYAMVNTQLSRSINRDASHILDPKHWEQASDHRPLLILIQ